MKKKVFGRKLSRSRPAREALFASLIRSMILSGKIVTTKAKAKAIQGDLEKIVTLAKKGDLSARRRVLAYLDNAKDATSALFSKVGPAFKERQSGFIRIISLPVRKGDNAKMARIEWTEAVELKSMSKSKDETKTKVKPKAKKVEEKPVKKVKAKTKKV